MKKNEFIEELAEILELEEENVTLKTKISLDSIAILSVIALLDEHFNMQVKAKDFQKISKISDLVKIIGDENFKD